MARRTTNTKDKVILVAGCLVVLFGLLGLIGVDTAPWTMPVRTAYRAISGYAWPIVILVSCLFIIWLVRRGTIVPPTGRPLMRSRSKRVIAGVCGGVSESFDLGPGWVRVLAVILLVASRFTFIIIYIVLWVIMPEEPLATDGVL